MGEPLPQNFQGQWVDFNEDGLLDLNLIRDRICYENKYYKQTEDGDFFNDAHAMELDYSINAMCTATTDFDRDNDQDLYMSAGMFEGNNFVLNDGTGVFDLHDPEEETASWSTSQAGPVRGLTWTTTVGKTCMCAPDFRLTRRGRQFPDLPTSR